MKLDPWLRAVAEYPSILTCAGQEGWLRTLVEAHLTPCDAGDAGARLRALLTRRTRWKVRLSPRRRGRARGPTGDLGYRVFLPDNPGVGAYDLRVGVVIHEAAHVIDHLKQKKFSHGETYRHELRILVEAWAKEGDLPAMYGIYERHRGPYSLLLLREVADKKGKTHEESDRVKGPFSAEEAHEEARMLVNDPRDNVTGAYVWSESENAHTGAWYRRGETYASWENELEQTLSHSDGGDRLRVAGDGAPIPLLPGGGPDEPLPALDAGGGFSLAPGAAEPCDPVPAVRPKAPRPPRVEKKPGDRFPVVRGKQLVLGSNENWPASQPAQTVKAYMEEGNREATSAEIVAALGATLTAQGVQFPGSLISRLKQAGHLKEKTS